MSFDEVFGVCDLETLGLDSDAVILSAAFVVHPLKDTKITFQELLDKSLYVKLDVKAQMELGRYADPSTVAWWKGQDAEAKEILKPHIDDFSPEDFRGVVYQWAKRWNLSTRNMQWATRGWLDFSVLDHFWRRTLGEEKTIAYHSKVEDLRTILNWTVGDAYKSPEDLGIEGFIHHNCLHDAALDWLRWRDACQQLGIL